MAARINVDGEFFADPRLDVLREAIGKEEAIGAVVYLWSLGQSYWKREEKIPLHVFELVRFGSELVRAGFARLDDDGVYCYGARERWHFLLAPKENGKKGGKASAESRKLKFGTAIPVNASNQTRSETEAESSEIRSKPKPSFSSSSSLSTKESPSEGAGAPAQLTLEQKTGKAFGLFIELFKAKYGAAPSRGDKGIQALKRVVKSEGLDRTSQLLQVFLQMQTDWFQERAHDLVTFENNINKISIALASGHEMTHMSERDWEEIRTKKAKALGGGNGIPRISGGNA
jgi:hypothetical protein